MTPEFSRPVTVARIASPGDRHDLRADAAECAAVAARLGVPAVQALTCALRLRAESAGVVLAEGTLHARLTQVCVVSTEEFDADLREEFAVRFVPEGTEHVEFDPDSLDEIPYAGGSIDLGELAVEQVALALDPYPRKPGVEIGPLEEDEEAAASPFAALARRQAKD